MLINRIIAARYLIIILLITVLLNTALIEISKASVANSTQLSTDKLTIQIFPEFSAFPDMEIDKPAVLVSYNGIMTNDTGIIYTNNIGIPVPIESTNFKIGLAIETKADQTQENLKYIVDNEKGLVYITPSKPININEQFEYDFQYYITPFDDTSRRSYSFIFTASSDIENLEVYVYPPLGARYFELNPTGINLQSNKLESYYYSYNNIKMDDNIIINFSYIKEDNIPTFDLLMLHSDKNNDLIDRNNKANMVLMLVLILIFGLIIVILIVKQKARLRIKEYNGSLKQLRGLYINNKISEAEYHKQRTELMKKERKDLE